MKTASNSTKNAQKYAKNVPELAVRLDLSARTVQNYKARPGFPAREPQGYNVESVSSFIMAEKEKAAARVGKGGALSELKCEKLREEIKLLRLRHDEAAGLTMLRADHVRALTAYCAIVRQAMETLPAAVAEISQNPATRRMVQDRCDSVLSAIDTGCKNYDDGQADSAGAKAE